MTPDALRWATPWLLRPMRRNEPLPTLATIAFARNAMTSHTPAATVSTAASPPGRLDIHAPIHRALRLFMTDTLARVGALDASDAADVAATLDQLDGLLDLCRQHLLLENQLVHPAIEALQPGTTRPVRDEHEQHLASIASLRDEAAALRAAPMPGAAQRLYRHLALFVADDFTHMHVEETALNQALWSCYDDAALAELERRIFAKATPQQSALVLRWLTPALSPDERAQRFRAWRSALPPEAFAKLLDVARQSLDERGWTRLSASLGDATLPT
jgi:hypothetical protein